MLEVARLAATDLSRILQTYDDYWRRIVSYGLKADPLPGGGLSVQLEDGGQVLLENHESAFVFRGLTARRDDRTREDYDAFVQIRQLIRGVREDGGEVRYEVSGSNLRIQYVEARTRGQSLHESGQPCRGYHGLHFDFQRPPDAFHPVVHAQVSPGCIPDSIVGRAYDCPVHRADVPRIPTPPIDLPTIVYIITNDHLMHAGLDPRAVKEKLQGVQSAARKLPRFARDIFPQNELPGGEMPCTWWYDR